jgi:hypothetical protein
MKKAGRAKRALKGAATAEKEQPAEQEGNGQHGLLSATIAQIVDEMADMLKTKMLKELEPVINQIVVVQSRALAALTIQAFTAQFAPGSPQPAMPDLRTLPMPLPLPDATSGKKKRRPSGPPQCPYPNCKNVGIRNLGNFCQEHFAKVPEEKRLELRKKQKEQRKRLGAPRAEA